LAIPNAILNKTGKLNQDEYEIIKQHPYYSYRIMEEVEGFQTIADWIGTHHEKLDGTGYPFKLKAAEISIGSRILAVSDIYCALLEARAYRTDMTTGQALAIMEEMVRENKVDGTVVHMVRCNADVLQNLIQKKILDL